MKGERLAHAGSYSLFGSGFGALAALALTIVVGNGLGAYGTGLFFQALGAFTIASQILRLGTNSTIVKVISEQRAFGRAGEAWRSVLIGAIPVVALAITAAVFMNVYADELAGWLGSSGEKDNLAELFRDMAPFTVMGALLAVLGTATRMLRGVEAFILVQNILSPLSRVLIVAAAIFLGWDALTAFRGWLVTIPLWLLVTVVVLARPVALDWKMRREALHPTWEATRSFWAFSSLRAVGAVFEAALEWSDVLIVAALRSPAEAGVYAVATRVVRVGQLVDQAMRTAASPTISRLLARSELVAARTLHTSVTRAMILSNWPYYLILATMGPALLSVFGKEFREGAIVLAILAGAMMVSAAAGMLQSILLQGGKSSWQMCNKGLALSISMGLNLLLVPVLGILGAAITWAAGVLVETAIAAWQVHKRMGVHLEPRKLLLAMGVPLVIFGIGGLTARLTFVSTLPTLLVALLILGSVYLVMLWLLREHLGIVPLWRVVPVVGRRAVRPVRSATPLSATTENIGERTA